MLITYDRLPDCFTFKSWLRLALEAGCAAFLENTVEGQNFVILLVSACTHRDAKFAMSPRFLRKYKSQQHGFYGRETYLAVPLHLASSFSFRRWFDSWTPSWALPTPQYDRQTFPFAFGSWLGHCWQSLLGLRSSYWGNQQAASGRNAFD